MPLDTPLDKEAPLVSNSPDDVWRAGADAIEAEDLSSGLDDVIEAGFGQPTTEAADALTDEEELAAANPDPVEEPAEVVEPVAETDAVEEEQAAVEDTPQAEADAETPVTGDEADTPVEDTAEAAAEEEPQKPIMIPKARLDQEAARRRALENQLREMQARVATGEDTPAEAAAELETMELDLGDTGKKMFDRVLEGDLDQANDLFSEIIRNAATAAAQNGYEKARSEMSNVVNQNAARSAEQVVIDSLEESYDFFRPADPAFDADAVNDTLAMQQGFIGQGYTPADAMMKAADFVIGARGLNAPAQELAPAPTPQEAPVLKPTRSAKDVQRNVEAQQAQPPAVQTGRSEPVKSDLPDITTMSMEEIDALPEATVKRLRGDYV